MSGSYKSGKFNGWLAGVGVGHGYANIIAVPGTQTRETQGGDTRLIVELSSCGHAGPEGPTDESCAAEYRDSKASELYHRTRNGVQQFKIPADGVYRFTLGGAAGGAGSVSAVLNPTTYRGGPGGKSREKKPEKKKTTRNRGA